MRNITNLDLYSFYWKITSIIWGFIFLDFNNSNIIFGTIIATGPAIGFLSLLFLAILAMTVVVYTNDKKISNDLIILGIIVPIIYVFWKITWLLSSLITIFILGMVIYYLLLNILTLIMILTNKNT